MASGKYLFAVLGLCWMDETLSFRTAMGLFQRFEYLSSRISCQPMASRPNVITRHRFSNAFHPELKPIGSRFVISAQHESDSNNEITSRDTSRLLQHILQMGLCGAALGPFLDGYHSAFGVLAYTKPVSINIANIYLLQTDYWVPPMFALAAIILGISYPALDRAFSVPIVSRAPTVPAVLTCISYFSFQYYLSGLLFSQGYSPTILHAVLAFTAAANWAIFDRTPTGAVMSVVTGLAGPIVEVGLLNAAPAMVGGALYRYSAPDVLGIPLWIGWVYACGAPAVGNLARLFWARP